MNDHATLDKSHELFCTLVASGTTYVEAAETAGFARNTGQVLMRRVDIKRRVAELLEEPTKAILAAKYWLAVIQTEAAAAITPAGSQEWRANMELHLRTLDKLARLHGWLVERKQVSQVTARVNVARGDLEAAIRADVERLAPGAMRVIESGADVDVKAIAAGELTPSTRE